MSMYYYGRSSIFSLTFVLRFLLKVFDHAIFARPGEPSRDAREGWEQTLRFYKHDQLRQEIREEEKRLAEEPSDEAFRRLRALKELETTGEEQHSGASGAETGRGPSGS